ncbi:hypothetical protein MATL_G00156030 [Megalops atlanticus]|uniref:Synaptotagmin-like protein 1 n=1 Tax=Megalops atlanticus TaxID=7932 RepID=A0A9D3T1V4_MEGAT|nr:hypothetical protein MATL_G00156030 [Megalops atlanticus]
MRSNGEVPSDLDLSFLSADEEAAIRQVLQRDEKLRKQETGRVRRLRLSVADPRQLKVMTGEWFDDLRSRRYGRQTVATDIVRSSIRRKKPPALRSNPFSDGGETQFGEEETGGQAEPADAPGCQPAFPRSRIPAPLTEEEDTTEEIALDNDGFVNRSEKRTVVKEEVAPRPVAYLSTERTAPPGIADISSVDVLEWTYPLYRADKQMPSGEKSLNPLVIQSEESPRYSRSADVETQASGQKTSLENSASAPGVVTAAPGTQNFPEMDSSPALEGVIGKGAEESLGGALSTGGVREQDQSKFLPDLPAGLAPISSDVGGGAVTTVRSMTQSQTGESHSTDTREEAESTYAKEQPVQKVTREGVKPLIPTIVVIPTEPSVPKDPKGCEHRAADPKASDPGGVPGPNPGSSGSTDPWEDEAVESDDDDCSSVSSVGSDLQGRRGLTSSALSLSGLSSSTFSVYSDAGDFGNLSVQGAVEFSLRYSSAGEVVITVAQCQDLAFANTRKQRTDPYVKTYLLPDKSRLSKRKTSIKKRTVNPVYGESLKYKIKKEELRERTLNLSVWHNDSRGRNVFLGQVEIDLSTWDWGHEALTWYNLLPKNSDTQESAECHGWLTVALKYVPARSAGGAGSGSGEIHVWLREARDLRRLKPQGVDSFVKCYMLPDTSRKSRQKTRVVKRSQHPVYNHAMVYDGFRPGEVREACCELSVWDHNTLSNQFLGGVRLSLGKGQSYGKNVDWMDSANQEVQLWEKMLSSPNTWVQAEVPLRSSMTPRK